MAKKKTEWVNVKGMEGFSVVGTKERFSINFLVYEGFRIGINGCRIVDGKNGEFISYPAWKDKDGEYHDYCYMTFDEKETKKIINALED